MLSEDPNALLEAFGGGETFPDIEEDEQATDPGAPMLGSDYSPDLDLSQSEQEEIARKLCDLLESYDRAMEERWAKLDRIADNYEMNPDDSTQGLQPNAAQACSEFTKSYVDNAASRISHMMKDTEPLIRVEPEGDGDPDPDSELAEDMAESMEEFGNLYLRHTIRGRQWIPRKVKRSTKYGVGLTRDFWEEKTYKYRYFDKSGKMQVEEYTYGCIVCRFVEHRDAIIWPINIDDWQEEYEMVGHRTRMSEWRFRELCTKLGTPESLVDEIIEGAVAEGVEQDDRERERHDVRTGDTLLDENQIQVTELWFHGAPEGLDPDKYRFFLHEGDQQLLYAGYNPLHCQKHPYWPWIYKESDRWALGEGVGEEIYPFHKADSALYNLEIDNAKVVGNNLILVREDSGADKFTNNLFPGRRIPVDDPATAIASVELGAPIELIHVMQERTKMRAMSATGLPNVLQGQGDINLKSGADVGSILALIEEAGKKFGDVDDGIKNQFSAEVLFWFELMQQFAPNGLFHKHLSPQKALNLSRMKWEPPRGRLEDQFRITVLAPSAQRNKTVQKQHLMIMLEITAGHLNELERLGQEILATEGMVASVTKLKRDIFTFRSKVYEALLDVHDLKGIKSDVPQLAPPQPAEVIISQMAQQLQQYNSQVQQLSAQNQALSYQIQGADPAIAAGQAGAGGMPYPEEQQ